MGGGGGGGGGGAHITGFLQDFFNIHPLILWGGAGGGGGGGTHGTATALAGSYRNHNLNGCRNTPVHTREGVGGHSKKYR